MCREAKGGGFFFFSHCRKFMIKSMEEDEKDARKGTERKTGNLAGRCAMILPML